MFTPALIASFTAKQRTDRNNLLAETDWWALADRTIIQEQINYRQALRDITDQSGFPNDIVWPVKP
jgi:hypothetical protein